MAISVETDDPELRALLSAMEQVIQVREVVSNLKEKVSVNSGAFIVEEREAVDSAAEILSLIGRFFEELYEIPDLTRRVAGDFGATVTVESFAAPLREIKVSASQPWKNGRLPTGISRVMREKCEFLLAEFSSLPITVKELAQKLSDRDARSRSLLFVEPYVDQVTARRVLAQAEHARDETLTVLDSAKRAAGEVGATEQAVHYKDFAESERKTANLLRYAVVAILVIMAVVATLTLGLIDSTSIGLMELSKLAVVVPLAVLAAYLGRESGRHRATANWSQELAMQLLTFDAFSAPIDEDVRTQLRAKLADQVFGGSTQPRSDSEHGPSVTADVIKLLETLGSLISNENKSNDKKNLPGG